MNYRNQKIKNYIKYFPCLRVIDNMLISSNTSDNWNLKIEIYYCLPKKLYTILGIVCIL